MKTMILSVALAALVASPALAQATRPYRQLPAYTSPQLVPNGNGHDAYGYTPYGGGSGVVRSGRYIGQDPDPNVRLQLKRDPVADY